MALLGRTPVVLGEGDAEIHEPAWRYLEALGYHRIDRDVSPTLFECGCDVNADGDGLPCHKHVGAIREVRHRRAKDTTGYLWDDMRPVR